ncbi:ras-related and estrogen-regulated growth inhibitor-like [Gigantopelta aegis]|uniref:ras-related and estrogen-regulated growth inhibitor-like n=1 Tax=Gigantopelta aegis TaxID=1735272 RepID=UPI001B88CFDB|nr:ras-related and estrogen-regulated growth inhibitor-like [Gigantopelta aegis]
MANPSSGSRILKRISNKTKPFRVAILGQNGVGKSAFTVRFITRRYIGEYDPLLEKVYCCTKLVDGEQVLFELLDTARKEGYTRLEENIKWADAYILMYSVADQCSLNECSRLKFLINCYSKPHRKSTLTPTDLATRAPVFLVGNQNDRCQDRMVSRKAGKLRSEELGCTSFYEISVRECVDSALVVLEDLFFYLKMSKKSRYLFSYTRSLSTDDEGGETFPGEDTPLAAREERAETPTGKDTPLASRRHALLTIG